MDSHRGGGGSGAASASASIGGSGSGGSYGTQFLLNLNLLPRSLSTVLEVTGLIPGRSHASSSQLESGSLVRGDGGGGGGGRFGSGSGGGEVAIRIYGEEEEIVSSSGGDLGGGIDEVGGGPSSLAQFDEVGDVEEASSDAAAAAAAAAAATTTAAATATATTTQRYDFQPLARWLEQVLPFTVLLLMVFIRQHLEGIAVMVLITAVMIRANVLLCQQTALKGERKKLVTGVVTAVLICDVLGVYWWYRKESIWRPLLLLPPRKIPKFWEAIFTIMVNDVMVRQAGMAIKCLLLLTCKSTRGRHFRKQGQLLTVVEYLLLLVRALIPGPVWYRFFLNKEYGNVFSSLTTGLYLAFKIRTVFTKGRKFIGAVGLFTRCEVQYGSVASAEEILAVGDMCAICQEKMHSPISLRCKHIFCEDCVSEWFERERTCPLCRAVVKPANFRSFADGRTSLLPQIF